MEQGKKIAFYAAGALLGAAFLLAWLSDTSRNTRPGPPLTTGAELDELAKPPASPAAPVGDHSPTWIPVSPPQESWQAQSGASSSDPSRTAESDVSSFGSSYDSDSEDQSASYQPSTPSSEQASQATPEQTVNSTPSNNAELREKLRGGK